MEDIVQSGWDALDLAWWQGLAAVGAVLAGGTISGLTGFGFALVIVPVLLLVFPPATVVVVVTSLAVASGIPILVEDRNHIHVRIVAPLLIPALVGLPVGVGVLTSLDTRYIKLVAGLVVIIFASIVARGLIIPGIRSRLAPIIAGFASGVLSTSTGMAGPPVVLFLTDRTPEPRVFRASITFYFCTTNLIGALLVIQTGSVGWREIGIAAALLPVALTGRRIGREFFHRVDEHQFRRISLGLLVVTGVSAMVTALSGLL